MVATILGSVGAIVTVLTVAFVIARAIFKLVNSTEDNTEALNKLTDKFDKYAIRVSDLETKVKILEDRWDRRS